MLCLVATNLVFAEERPEDGMSLDLDSSSRIEVKGEAMIENKSSVCLVLRSKSMNEFELARWTKDFSLYEKIGLEIPSIGVHPGLFIVDAKMGNGIVAVVVKYETEHYIVVALVGEKKSFKPQLIENFVSGGSKKTILEVVYNGDKIEVTLENNRKEIVGIRN